MKYILYFVSLIVTPFIPDFKIRFSFHHIFVYFNTSTSLSSNTHEKCCVNCNNTNLTTPPFWGPYPKKKNGSFADFAPEGSNHLSLVLFYWWIMLLETVIDFFCGFTFVYLSYSITMLYGMSGRVYSKYI